MPCCTRSQDAPHYGQGATHHHELCSAAAFACPDAVIDQALFMTAAVVAGKAYTLRVFDPRVVVPYLISMFGVLLFVNGRRVVFNPEKLFDSMAEARVIILCFDESSMLQGFCFLEPTSVQMQKRRFVEIKTGCGEGVPYATSPTLCDATYVSAMSSIRGIGQPLVDLARRVAAFSPSQTLLLDALDGTHHFYKRCGLVNIGKTEGKRAENGMCTFGGKAYDFDVESIKTVYRRANDKVYDYPFDMGFNDRLGKLLKLSKTNPEEAASFAGCRALAYVPTAAETLTKEQLFAEDLRRLDQSLKNVNTPVKDMDAVFKEVRAKRVSFKDEEELFGAKKDRDVAKTSVPIEVAFQPDAERDAERLEPEQLELDGEQLELDGEQLELDGEQLELDEELFDGDFPMSVPAVARFEFPRELAELVTESVTEPVAKPFSLADVKKNVREALEFAALLQTSIAAVDEASALMEGAMAEHAAAVEAARIASEAARIAQAKAAELAARVQQAESNRKRAASEVEEMVSKRQRLF